jgi:hypothetical protein
MLASSFRKLAGLSVIRLQRQSLLLQIVTARSLPSRFTRRLNRWQQERGQNADNRYYDQQLNESEA